MWIKKKRAWNCTRKITSTWQDLNHVFVFVHWFLTISKFIATIYIYIYPKQPSQWANVLTYRASHDWMKFVQQVKTMKNKVLNCVAHTMYIIIYIYIYIHICVYMDYKMQTFWNPNKAFLENRNGQSKTTILKLRI